MKNETFKLETKGLLKQVLILFLIGGVGATLLFGKFMGVHDFKSFVKVAVFQGMIWIILSIGNGFLSSYLNSKISWLEKPELRFIVGTLLTVVYTIGALSILLLLSCLLIFGTTYEQAIQVFDIKFFITALLITALISMFLHGRSFLIEWRASASEAERLKNENLKARFETLKNQVNPHFLFNSFNVLSSLVYKDQDLAAKFIKQMSNLYRYVLESRDKETVRLEEEVAALKSFSFLSKMRFGDNLDIRIDLDEIRQFQIAPMTLQMLVENAIKHNVVSKAKPLFVQVFHEKGEIIVKNNLQLKNNVTASTGIGLPNIQARYEYLSDQAISVFESNNDFIVKIPLLKL